MRETPVVLMGHRGLLPVRERWAARVCQGVLIESFAEPRAAFRATINATRHPESGKVDKKTLRAPYSYWAGKAR